MFNACSRSLLCIILFQTILLNGSLAKKYKPRRPQWLISQQLLRRNNTLLAKSNKIAAVRLEVDKEILKASQEHNRILMLIMMQNDAVQNQAHEPLSPASSCATPHPAMSASVMQLAGRVAPATPQRHSAARSAGSLSMIVGAQAPRLTVSASTPSLQALEHAAAGGKKGAELLSTIASSPQTESAAGAAGAAGQDGSVHAHVSGGK